MSKRRVVITGLGMLSSVGNSVEESWEKLVAGTSGIDHIKSFDVTNDFSSRIGGEVKGFDPREHFEKKRIKKLDRYTQFALVSARQAVQDAALIDAEFNHDRAGVIIASGIGGMFTYETEAVKLALSGPRRVSPFFVPKMISNAASAEVAIEFQFRGMNFNVTSACASANHAMGTAFRAIQYGDADIMLSGGAEASVTPLTLAGFCSLKALSTRNDDPTAACRPFDKERDGFLLAEGAGVLVLEELEHARARGAKIYAEIVGYAATCDAYHITAPSPGGEGGARAMQMAIKDAGIKPEDIDYINAHGTSTPLNDKNETASIKSVFGDHAKEVSINSTKSMVGHSLGAAAGMEAIVCCKTINTGIIHPTTNQTSPDPDCDLNFTPNTAVKKEVTYALNNSLGFGGHNGVLIFKKYQ
ncbi:MAG: beta-ketoacyl-ACP synthase II [Candidatus Cloacimonetes bacterium]|nr:beta-ketoacyl-ACP synthase II [Candidatus Cloacimonadota bacterium]